MTKHELVEDLRGLTFAEVKVRTQALGITNERDYAHVARGKRCPLAQLFSRLTTDWDPSLGVFQNLIYENADHVTQFAYAFDREII